MRHLILSIFTISPILLFGQNLPVSQSQEMTKAVIEEFTAHNCGNCPAGHEAAGLTATNLGENNVLIVGYHYGSLAAPSSSAPDFRTSDGNALGSFLGIQGTPTGPVNRGSFGGNSFSLSANSWLQNSTQITSQAAEANIALNVTIDPVTREATINTEVFYLSNSSNTHYLTIGFTESEIVAPQTSYNASWNAAFFNPDGSYRHQHVFRGFIDGSAGTAIDASNTNVIPGNYSFTIPANNNGHEINLSDPNNLEFFAILHEGENGPTNSVILNAAKVHPSIPGANIAEDALESVKIYPNPSKDGSFTLTNLTPESTITILDVQGKEIPYEVNQSVITISIAGIYFVQIRNNNGVELKKVIVQ